VKLETVDNEVTTTTMRTRVQNSAELLATDAGRWRPSATATTACAALQSLDVNAHIHTDIQYRPVLMTMTVYERAPAAPTVARWRH